MATTGTGRLSACGSLTYKWSREEYTPRMALLSGRAYDTANCECAVVCAYLIKRPPRWLADGSESIFVDLDEETEEGDLVSGLFADSHGGVPVPALASRPKWSKSAASGGLVVITEVKVQSTHRGRGIGIELIDDLLERELHKLHQPAPFLGITLPATMRYEWSLAALRPMPLTREEDSSRGADPNRLRRYYARAGFWPAGVRHATSLHGFWCAVRETREKLSKEAADALELPPDLQPLSEADEEFGRYFLPRFVQGSKRGPPSEAQARDLIAQGADLARVKPLHGCIQMGWNMEYNEMFLRLGADVNVRDEETGETVMHVVARHGPYLSAEEMNRRIDTARKLLEHGASRDILDDRGMTAAAVISNSLEKFFTKYGYTIPDSSLKQCIDLFEMLLPPEQRAMLVNGCISPRMQYRLKVATEVAPDICRDSVPQYARGERLEPDEIDDVWLIESVPVEVRAGDIYPSFVKGWLQALEAVRDTFAAGEALTVSNVRRRFQGMYASHFEGRGGSVAHAIDAVLYRSQVESEVHGDGSFFDCDKFEAEHDALVRIDALDNNYAYVRLKFAELNGAPLPYTTERKRMRVEDYMHEAMDSSSDDDE